MPDAAEVVALVLELLDLDYFGEAFDAFHERILDRLPHSARERHELRRLERLIAEEDDLMLEKRLSNFPYGKLSRQIDAEDLGAERPGDAADLYGRSSSKGGTF
jgi:hypothetical protein